MVSDSAFFICKSLFNESNFFWRSSLLLLASIENRTALSSSSFALSFLSSVYFSAAFAWFSSLFINLPISSLISFTSDIFSLVLLILDYVSLLLSLYFDTPAASSICVLNSSGFALTSLVTIPCSIIA